MSFTHVQFIAYEVPTGVGLPSAMFDVTKLELYELVKDDPGFASALAGLTADARWRLGRLLGVVEQAMKSDAVKDQDANTLKVFMAPEFYFRPETGSGPARSYPAGEMLNIQAALRRVFQHKAWFADWLLVLGTVVWNLKGKIVLDDVIRGEADRLKYAQALQQLASQDVVYNSALVAPCGYGIQVYDKLHYSEGDAIQNPYRATIQAKTPNPKRKADVDKFNKTASSFDLSVDDSMVLDDGTSLRTALADYFQKCGARGIEQCLVPAANLRCGLEVCLDHDLKVLKKSYEAFAKTWPKSPQNQGGNSPLPSLDMQLLIACGMLAQKNSVMVGKNRYLFRVDGSVVMDHPERFDKSELQLVLDTNNKGEITKLLTADTNLNEWKKLNTPAAQLELSGDLAMSLENQKAAVFDVVDNSNPKEPVKALVEKPLKDHWTQRLVVYKQLPLSHLNAK